MLQNGYIGYYNGYIGYYNIIMVTGGYCLQYSDGIESIFFLVAGMVLCFQFRVKIILITLIIMGLVFAEQHLHFVKDFSSYSTALQAKQLGGCVRSWACIQLDRVT